MTNPAETIQRYGHGVHEKNIGGNRVVWTGLGPLPAGDWVRYVDHQRILAAALAEVEVMRALLIDARDELDNHMFSDDGEYNNERVIEMCGRIDEAMRAGTQCRGSCE